jgi:hypothetical protein
MDIGCVFGCRREQTREKTNERGRRHYETSKGKANKSVLNRNRGLNVVQQARSASENLEKPAQARPDQASEVFHPSLLGYIVYLLSLASSETPTPQEIAQPLHELLSAVMKFRITILRQRSLPERGG